MAWRLSLQRQQTDAVQETQVDGNWSRGRHDVTFGLHQRRTSSNEVSGWAGRGMARLRSSTSNGRACRPASASPTSRARAFHRAARARGAGRSAMSSRRTAGRSILASGSIASADVTKHQALPPTASHPRSFRRSSIPAGRRSDGTICARRLGVTYRLTDTTILRGSYARFANQLSSSLITFDNAAGSGSIPYFFRDTNGDHLAQASELMGPTGTVSGVIPADPGSAVLAESGRSGAHRAVGADGPGRRGA